MSKFTQFLKLLMKDPVADGADTFDIQTMLNENWEKIDAKVVARSPFILTYGDEDLELFDEAVAAYNAGRPVILHRWDNGKLHQSSLSMTDYTPATDVLVFREPMESGSSTNCRFIRENEEGYVYWTMESKYPTPADIGAPTTEAFNELADNLAENGKGFKRIGYLNLDEDVECPIYFEADKYLSHYHTVIVGIHNLQVHDSSGNPLKLYLEDPDDGSYTKFILNIPYPSDPDYAEIQHNFAMLSIAGGLREGDDESLQYAGCYGGFGKGATSLYATLRDTKGFVLDGWYNSNTRYTVLEGSCIEVWGVER